MNPFSGDSVISIGPLHLKTKKAAPEQTWTLRKASVSLFHHKRRPSIHILYTVQLQGDDVIVCAISLPGSTGIFGKQKKQLDS